MAQVHNVEGSVVDGFCPKCEAITEHTIIKATKRSIREVKCEACTFVHKYQKTGKTTAKGKAKAKAKTKKRKSRKKTQEVDLKAQVLAEWEASCLEHAAVEPRDYDMKVEWEPGQVVLHSKFGKGVILKKLSDKKVEVIFKDSRKRLVQKLKS